MTTGAGRSGSINVINPTNQVIIDAAMQDTFKAILNQLKINNFYEQEKRGERYTERDLPED